MGTSRYSHASPHYVMLQIEAVPDSVALELPKGLNGQGILNMLNVIFQHTGGVKPFLLPSIDKYY